MPPETIHLHPTAALAPRVLLPGDPGRALLLAQLLLEEPKMFNHHRGLWGYTGAAPDDEPLSIQATGMGGPSAAIVVEELIRLGARTLVRVGTCGALAPGLALGELVVARAAHAGDGTSRALGGEGLLAGDPGLADALAAAAGGRAGTVLSTDLFYEPGGGAARPRSGVDTGSEGGREGGAATHTAADRPQADGALAVEMECATLFRLAQLHGVRAGCVLAVSDLLGPGGERRRIEQEELRQAAERAGQAALVAVTASASASSARAASAPAGAAPPA